MAAGLGTLRLSPAAFWSMTPRELAAALSILAGPPPATPPDRTTLERLMRQYP